MIDFGNGQPNKERGCNFQAYVINSMTVSTFPVEPTLCWSVTGSVRLDETTDVSHEKLTALFKYLNVLTGKLEIINTQFRNLSFFRPLFSVTGATGEASEVLLIANNSKLETMAGGALLYPVIDRIRIEDNPMLDVNCSHVLENYATLRTIRRNRVNCGCELDGSLTTTNIDTIPDNCDYIFGKLEISGENSPNAEVLTRKFGKATNITGELAILNTNLTSLEFLSNLVNITSKYNVYAEEFIEQFVRIENNVMLERLGWDKLEVVYMSTVSISANPKLCYTVAELDALLYSEYVNVIEGKLCAGDEHSGNSTHICRLANNATLSNLPASCSSITGQLTLDHTMDASDLWKLYNVTSIYGSLSVVNTSMIGLSPLWNLRRLCNPSLIYLFVLLTTQSSRCQTKNVSVSIELLRPILVVTNKTAKESVSATIQVAANPKLCVTIPELSALLRAWNVHKVEAKVCDEIYPSEIVEHVCRVGDSASLDTIPANCRTLVGQLTIDHRSSRENLWKLYNVTTIYGKLIIRNSSLAGVSSLWKLSEMINLAGHESALVVESNERLKTVYMRDFLRITSDLPVRIENNPRLEMSSDECQKYVTQTRFSFQGNKLDCLSLTMMSASIGGGNDFTLLFLSVFSIQFL